MQHTTAPTSTTNPLDPNAVANLDVAGFRAGAELDDGADALVPTDLALLCRRRQDGPGVCHDAEVGVADAGVCAVSASASCSSCGIMTAWEQEKRTV